MITEMKEPLLVHRLLNVISEHCLFDPNQLDQTILLKSFDELGDQGIDNFEETLKTLIQEVTITRVLLEQLLKLFSYHSGFFGNPFEHFTTIALYLKHLGLHDDDLKRVTEAILCKEPKV